MNLYIFTPNGDSNTSFLGNPFLPIYIAPPSAQYANTQLQAILSTDAPGTCPFYDAVHTWQLMNQSTTAQTQAENSFTFDVPADHTDAQYVIEGNLVAFLDLDGNYQLFEIRKIDEFHTDTLYKQAYCVNAAPAELIDEWVDNLSLTNESASNALSAVLNGTRWMVGTVNLTNTESLVIQRANTLATLGALIAQWGGEMQFRVEISGTSISGMYVDWLQTVGNVTGKRFEYGKDMVSVQRTLDAQSIKTALYGYGQQDNAGNCLTFANVTWSTANGDPVDKPPGQTWIGDPTALQQWGRNAGTRNRFGSFSDTQQTDPAMLLQETWDYLQTINTPLVSYQMSVVDLETLAGYSWEAIRIGDTVNVIDTTFQPVLRLTARVVEIQRDLIEPTNTQVTLGNFLPTLAGTQAQLQNVQQTNVGVFDGGLSNSFGPGSPLPTTQLQGVIDALANEVQSTGGYVYITNSDGILVLDQPKGQNPTKAIRLKGGVLAIANTQTNGQWNWTTFGTGDGFTADVINAGTLKGVSLLLGGLNNGNGQFTLEDNDGNELILMNSKGIQLSNGATILGGSGVLSELVFQSSGQYQGWQHAGWWSFSGYFNLQALIFAYIPDNFVVDTATLYTKAMPVYENDASGTAWWNISNAKLMTSSDGLNGYYNYNPDAFIEMNSMTDISSGAWGGYWNPTGETIQVKSADVSQYCIPGQRVAFGVNSNDASSTNYAGSLVQFELVVTGYKNG